MWSIMQFLRYSHVCFNKALLNKDQTETKQYGNF